MSYEFASTLVSYWQPRLVQYLFKPSEAEKLHSQLPQASSFLNWHELAVLLDHEQGNDLWRANPKSHSYDFKLVSSLALRLDQLRSQKRFDELIEVIRSGLVRNIGSIGSPALFSHAYSGTKVLIEGYIHSVVRALREISGSGQCDPDFFKDARQSYGRTALVLHGGSLFGMCHLGVVKSLLYASLLPPVICGTTTGAIAAAFVCSLEPERLESAINSLPTVLVETVVAGERPEGLQKSSSKQLVRTLFTKEVLLFHKYVHEQLGDLTFEEAYRRSGRILNVLVLPLGAESGTFYNYLSTPKVTVRSAVLASLGSGVVPNFEEVVIVEKDYNGEVRAQKATQFIPANDTALVPARKSPYTRLAELFNVNNYIVSIARPYLAPFLLCESRYRGKPQLWRKLVSLACVSAQYRINQLAEWIDIAPWLKSIFVDEIIPGGFQVNIVPESDSIVRDFLLAFDSSNLASKIRHWIELGERSVWPQISIVWVRTKIEYVLGELQSVNEVNGGVRSRGALGH